jgi:hypothetical protein
MLATYLRAVAEDHGSRVWLSHTYIWAKPTPSDTVAAALWYTV